MSLDNAPEVTGWDRLAHAILDGRPGLVDRLATDPQAYLELISIAASARSETAVLLSAAVTSARRAGCTWGQIGDVLGVSRQAAQQQYGEDTETSNDVGRESMLLAPLTSFTEMDVLNRAGRYGWHGVEFGPAYFRVERDTRQWEHFRTVLTMMPATDGWQRIGWGWMWWRYWARPLDIPALTGNPSATDFVRNELPN